MDSMEVKVIKSGFSAFNKYACGKNWEGALLW